MQSIHPEAIDYLISVDNFYDFNNAQKDILSQEYLDYSSNYIVATNTGTGKTALAQLRIVDTLKKREKVIFVSPYKSITEEKRQDFEYYTKYGWSCISSANPNETKDSIDYSKFNIISITYEKFDSILNNARFIKGWLKDVGLVVVDEAHMISDTERGPTLESAITKVIILFDKKIRILMLSAVLPNVNNIANWVNAKYGTSTWRPVDLEIGFAVYGGNLKSNRLVKKTYSELFTNKLSPKEIRVKYGSLNKINEIIYINNLKEEEIDIQEQKKAVALKEINENPLTVCTDPYDCSISITNSTLLEKENVKEFQLTTTKRTQNSTFLNAIYKALEKEQNVKDIDNPLWFLSEQTIRDNGQVLIFSTDRASTESIALELADLMNNSKDFHKYLSSSDLKEIDKNYILKMKLKDEKLITAMKNGVAFHHAGLDLEKRKLVEDAYKSGKIKILLSTTTLIAGVNLPATLVIFDSLSFWDGNKKQIMTKRDFLNGCGRAGRPGLETRARALIMASSIISAIQFIARPLEKVESQFNLDSLVFQTLSIIKRNSDLGKKFTTINDINEFFKNTFYYSNGFKTDIRNYIGQLLNMEMISIYRSPHLKDTNSDIHDIKEQLDSVRENKSETMQEKNISNDNNHRNTDSNNIRYSITKLGYETIRFYLNPRTGFLIRNMLLALESFLLKSDFNSTGLFLKTSTPQKISVFSIIHSLIHAKELQNSWKTTKLKDKETEFVKDHSQEIMLNRSMYDQLKLSEDERKCLCTAMAFYAKLNMDDILHRSSFESLYQRFGRGDFTSLQENMEWLVEASLKISNVILINNSKSQKVISNMLDTLSKRISFGMIKEELLELCSIREIGRIRSILLQNAGIVSINQLINPHNKLTISNIIGSEQITHRVIEDARKIYNEKKYKGNKINN